MGAATELVDPFPFGLVPSLDIDRGEIWLVPDYIGQGVYRFSQSSAAFSGPNPFLAGLGYASAERTGSAGGTLILAVINKPHNGLPPSEARPV